MYPYHIAVWYICLINIQLPSRQNEYCWSMTIININQWRWFVHLPSISMFYCSLLILSYTPNEMHSMALKTKSMFILIIVNDILYIYIDLLLVWAMFSELNLYISSKLLFAVLYVLRFISLESTPMCSIQQALNQTFNSLHTKHLYSFFMCLSGMKSCNLKSSNQMICLLKSHSKQYTKNSYLHEPALKSVHFLIKTLNVC